MENSIITTRRIHWNYPIVTIIFLAISCFGLFHDTLSAGWRFDDGDHLNFAATYAPWQYFFVPEITRLQSGANLTPWNAFFYDINLSIFGLAPAGFYLHQLIILWLTSIATYFLLRLWIGWSWALFGALLFLVGAPTAYIANQVMTGHYASGLLFTVIALYAYVRAVQGRHQSFALLSAFFYLLAVTCKEIYVPFIAVLLFLPVGTMRDRLHYVWPSLFVVIIYLVWRTLVLGRLFGGYNLSGTYDPLQILSTFGKLPLLLLGENLVGVLAFSIIILLIVNALYRKQINMVLLVSAAGLLLFPLIPLVSYPGVTAPDRYLFSIWWALSILLVCILSVQKTQYGKYAAWGIAILLGAVSLQHSREERKAIANFASVSEKSYEFILNSHKNQVYVAPDFDYYLGAVLPGAVMAQKALHPLTPERAQVIPDIEQLSAIDLTHNSVWRYSTDCRCVENITSAVPAMVSDYRNRLALRALSVNLHLDHLKAEWDLGPYDDGEYAIMINNQGFFILPRSGAQSYPRQVLDGYIRYKSPEGWITRSESFHLDVTTQSNWQWSRF